MQYDSIKKTKTVIIRKQNFSFSTTVTILAKCLYSMQSKTIWQLKLIIYESFLYIEFHHFYSLLQRVH